jgi:hypothetical protein
MLYFPKRDFGKVIDAGLVQYGRGRGEFGECLHLPLKDHTAGGAQGEDYYLMMAIANNLIEYLLYKRPIKGPEAWDYDPEKANEMYEVCGDNPNTSGIIIADRSYNGGAKLQIFLDKTFGANEVAIRWKNELVGDDFLMNDYMGYLKQAIVNGEFAIEETQ